MEELIFNDMNKSTISNRTFVMCDCGEEIIEFQRILFDGFITYNINFHGWYNRRLQRYSDFEFDSIMDFITFMRSLKAYLNGNRDNTITVFNCSTVVPKRHRSVLILNADPDKGYITLSKSKSIKAKKDLWEVVLRTAEVEQLYESLRKWFEV